jgi:hypothetical protein
MCTVALKFKSVLKVCCKIKLNNACNFTNLAFFVPSYNPR